MNEFTQVEKCPRCGNGDDYVHIFQYGIYKCYPKRNEYKSQQPQEGQVTYFEINGLWYSESFGISRVHSNRGSAFNYSLDMNHAYSEGAKSRDAEVQKLSDETWALGTERDELKAQVARLSVGLENLVSHANLLLRSRLKIYGSDGRYAENLEVYVKRGREALAAHDKEAANE